MKSIELARALAAAMSLRLPGTVGKVANKMRYIDSKAPLFVEGGIIRKRIESRRFERIYAVGISSKSRSMPALGGILYGAAALRHDIVVTGTQVTEGFQDSRVDINDMNFLDASERLAVEGVHPRLPTSYGLDGFRHPALTSSSSTSRFSSLAPSRASVSPSRTWRRSGGNSST